MKKFIFAATLLFVASLTMYAQTQSVVHVQKKCPIDCDLQKWDYETYGFIETITNPDLRGSIAMDWEHMTVRIETGQVFRFEHRTNEKEQSVTIIFEGHNVQEFL